MKLCSRCGTEKSLDEFFNDKNTGDGKYPACKQCVYERRKNPKPKFISDTHKKCSRCDEIKLNDKFYKDSAKYSVNGRHSLCISCKDSATNAWREDNKEQYNASMRAYNAKNYQKLRLQRYDLTPERHAQMLVYQKGVCAICEQFPKGKRPLVVDHCHKTEKVRGLLCYGCNRALHILDTPELLEKAERYLKKS